MGLRKNSWNEVQTGGRNDCIGCVTRGMESNFYSVGLEGKKRGVYSPKAYVDNLWEILVSQ